jgi:ribosomal protein S18 acetylase RimI-like enzyme
MSQTQSVPATAAPVIRQLTPGDADAYRALRLEGLASHPDVFGDSWVDEFSQPLAWFAERLASNTIFGGWILSDGRLDGIAGLMIPKQEKRRHKGVLWGMYIRPEARSIGLAAALLTHVLDHARGLVEAVRLTAVADNRAAIRLYEVAGFEPYALERRAIKIGEEYHDELMMEITFSDTAR